MARVRLQSERFLPQMTHCARCRADAAGLVGDDNTAETMQLLQESARASGADRPHVAVASMEGAFVNQHLGEADRFMVFAQDLDTATPFRFLEHREAPPRGEGDDRWLKVATSLQDCRALLVSAAGPNPKKILEATGLRVVQMEGLIEEGLAAVFAGEAVPPALSRQFQKCGKGVTCGGDGQGCG